MNSIIEQNNNILQHIDNNKILDYFSSVSDIIETYYKVEDAGKIGKRKLNLNSQLIMYDDIKEPTSNNLSINDIYWVDDKYNSTETKDNIVKTFNNVVYSKPIVNYYNYNKCRNCNCDMYINTNDGIIICDNCGNVENILIESEIPSYKDNGSDKPIYPYKRLNHFIECINQFQAKENIEIPQYIYDKLTEIFKKKRVKDFKTLTLTDVRRELKALKLNKYYEHVSYIYSKLSGNEAPKLTYAEENKIKLLFKQIDKSFNKFCPKDRNNFFNYNYLLHKLFKIIGMEQYLEYFPLLKSKEKLLKQDEIWKLICKDLNFKYMTD